MIEAIGKKNKYNTINKKPYILFDLMNLLE